jgi:hypothetical protein
LKAFSGLYSSIKFLLAVSTSVFFAIHSYNRGQCLTLDFGGTVRLWSLVTVIALYRKKKHWSPLLVFEFLVMIDPVLRLSTGQELIYNVAGSFIFLLS